MMEIISKVNKQTKQNKKPQVKKKQNNNDGLVSFHFHSQNDKLIILHKNEYIK